MKKLKRGEITQAEYDSVLFSLYSINKSNFKTDANLLKTKGVYILRGYSDYYKKDDYRFMKLDSIGNAFLSYRFYDTVNNQKINTIGKGKVKYTLSEGELLIERLDGPMNSETTTIITHGRISGDTIIFYKSHKYGDLYGHTQLNPHEHYIYCDTLKLK